jgi:tetratricopeptide (TPR) repeat protein
MLLKCLSFEFHSPFTYASLGFLYRDLGNQQRAIALLKRAMEQESQSTPVVAFELGKLLARSGMLTEALVYFTKALELCEADPLAK